MHIHGVVKGICRVRGITDGLAHCLTSRTALAAVPFRGYYCNVNDADDLRGACRAVAPDGAQ